MDKKVGIAIIIIFLLFFGMCRSCNKKTEKVDSLLLTEKSTDTEKAIKPDTLRTEEVLSEEDSLSFEFTFYWRMSDGEFVPFPCILTLYKDKAIFMEPDDFPSSFNTFACNRSMKVTRDTSSYIRREFTMVNRPFTPIEGLNKTYKYEVTLVENGSYNEFVIGERIYTNDISKFGLTQRQTKKSLEAPKERRVFEPLPQRKVVPQPAPKPTHYVIKPGDTFYSVAKTHSLTTENLMRLNPTLGFGQFIPGTKIKIR